jgi:hypothetical protein
MFHAEHQVTFVKSGVLLETETNYVSSVVCDVAAESQSSGQKRHLCHSPRSMSDAIMQRKERLTYRDMQ